MEVQNYEGLDVEWMQLIKEALDLGLTKEDIRSYLAKDYPQELVLEK
ncbi:anti-repressor SinI family protein [Mesobacillus maritimus]|nr:anti-repressor SinI family protein [Mesobacillus maritimus]MCM3585534.1 anti-repressor SinI family protein [Mesobacillus maritimus]